MIFFDRWAGHPVRCEGTQSGNLLAGGAMSPRFRSKCQLLALAVLPVLVAPLASLATDIHGVQPAALDQPRVNAIVSLASGGDPLWADFGGQKAFNMQAFYDTGASGVLLSANT